MNVDDERYTNEFTIQPYYSFNTRPRQTINRFSRSMSYPSSRSLYTCTRTYIFLAKSQTFRRHSWHCHLLVPHDYIEILAASPPFVEGTPSRSLVFPIHRDRRHSARILEIVVSNYDISTRYLYVYINWLVFLFFRSPYFLFARPSKQAKGHTGKGRSVKTSTHGGNWSTFPILSLRLDICSFGFLRGTTSSRRVRLFDPRKEQRMI